MYSENPKTKRFEFRCPDPTANGYLLWSAMLMAVIDGIQKKIDPGQPLDANIYALPEKQKSKIKSVPGSLQESLRALQNDHAFLTQGNVFSDDLIQTYVDYKKEFEIDPLALRPHPYEFALYYDN
jgi:glutamine synthetase